MLWTKNRLRSGASSCDKAIIHSGASVLAREIHPIPTRRHYPLEPSESFVLKFKSTLQSVFYTRALAILIVHKASKQLLLLRYTFAVLGVTHLPVPASISTKSPMNTVCIMLIYYRWFNYSFVVHLRFLCWCSFCYFTFKCVNKYLWSNKAPYISCTLLHFKDRYLRLDIVLLRLRRRRYGGHKTVYDSLIMLEQSRL